MVSVVVAAAAPYRLEPVHRLVDGRRQRNAAEEGERGEGVWHGGTLAKVLGERFARFV